MLERKAVFTMKKEKRKSDLTGIKKNEERELQDQLNVSRIKAHAANAQLPQGSRLSSPDVNAILRAERDKLKRELKAKQVARQKAFDEEFDALEKKLQKHNSYHRWLADQSKLDDEHGDLAKHLYMESKMREQIDKQKRIEQGGETFQAPAVNPNSQSFLSISKDVEKLGYKAYDNKTHIAYVRTVDYKVKFKDYGNTISISNQEDQSIRDAMTLAIEKWGKVIKVKGNSEFQAKAIRIAFELGVKEIQSDDKEALDIFRALKEGKASIGPVKQQPDSNDAHPLSANEEKYIDFSDQNICDKLNKTANLLKIAEKYGYSIEKQKGNAVRLIKGKQILNISISSDNDVFFMKCPLGFNISGTAQDFIRQEEYLSYADAAQRLFILNRLFPKNVEAEANKAYDVAYVRHLFNSASNNTDNIAALANKGLYRHDLGNDSRINDNGEIFFAHRNVANDIVGFEIIKENSPMFFVKGGQKGIYHANDPQDDRIERVVITLEAIDAEAIKRLETKQHPELLRKTLYLSVGGTAGKRQIEHLKRYESIRMELHVTTEGDVDKRVLHDLKNALENLEIVNDSGSEITPIADLYRNRERHSSVMVELGAK
jgi:hypothetical protein